MRTLSRYQYERGLPARRLVDCINMLAVSEGVEEGWGGQARVAIPRQAVALSHRSCEAEIKLSADSLQTSARASWPTLVSKSSLSSPSASVLPHPSPIAALPFQSDCFRGCLCGPQIGFLLCRTALRIEFELIPLTRPADLCPTCSHLHALPAKANLIILIIIAHTFRSPNPSQPRVRAPD